MIEYLIGVDGGGTGTRVRLADREGRQLGQGESGPSGLGLGIARAWSAVRDAIAAACADAALPTAPPQRCAIGLGLAGVHNKEWAAQFLAADPGYGSLRLDTDGYTTLLGAHQGQPGIIVAIGTGSVGQALLPDGAQREVGGWGFPSGDEASGGWIGLAAINHIEKVLDGRRPASAFANELIQACGGQRDAVQAWLGHATQTAFAALAPTVLKHAASDPVARRILEQAGQEVAEIAHALDPSGQLPLALCGGLGAPLRAYLPPALLARSVAPHGDAASGALRMIAMHLQDHQGGPAHARPAG
jgi:glucosamine kinase